MSNILLFILVSCISAFIGMKINLARERTVVQKKLIFTKMDAIAVGLFVFLLVLIFIVTPIINKKNRNAPASVKIGSGLFKDTICVTEFSINAKQSTLTFTDLDSNVKTVPMSRVFEINESSC